MEDGTSSEDSESIEEGKSMEDGEVVNTGKKQSLVIFDESDRFLP